MGHKAGTKIYAIFFAIIILAASFLFFHFRKSDNQRNVAFEADKGSTYSRQENTAPAEIQNNSGSKSEQQKIIPAKIPILMFHYIRDYSDSSDPIGENLSVSPSRFEEDMNWLKANGYQSIFPDFLENPAPLASKPVILSFDDGYQDAYDSAFPVLQKYRIVGIFYLIVDKIGTPGYLSWEEILEMQKAGMRFGSHTLTHPDLRNLTGVSLEKEIKGSKDILEQKLGQEIADFCYPSGKYNEKIIKTLQSDGYRTAMTTDSGISTLESGLYALPRLRIVQNTDFQKILLK